MIRARQRKRRRFGIQSLERREVLTGGPNELVDFEDVGANLATEDYWIGPDPNGQQQQGGYGDTVVSGKFTSGRLDFNNVYSLDYGTWGGWSYSNTTDTTTPGYTNQLSAIAGGGAGGSPTYAVAFFDAFGVNPPPTMTLTPPVEDWFVHSLQVTNTTYAALSMLQGDDFAKKFGGASGNDPDWFLMTIEGKTSAGDSVGEVDFYLADYRFADNSKDYIIDDWTEVDVSSLRGAVTLEFSFTSSDVGPFGMNTPTYVAIDDVVLAREVDPNEPPELVSVSTSSPEVGGAVRGQQVTVSGSFTDADPGDVHEVLIDWGDGQSSLATVDQLAGTFTATHAYATGGVFDVSATVEDQEGLSDSMVAGATIGGVRLTGDGRLQIVGVDAPDNINVSEKVLGTLKVTAKFDLTNVTPLGKETHSFSTASVQAIEMYLGDGDDVGKVAGTIAVVATIYGDEGSDQLSGGAGDDELFGGDGNDTLAGASGDDLLDGGDGDDALKGGDGDDEMLGGKGIDYLAGGNGNDSLEGGDDNDTLVGGNGNDTLAGDDGDDTLTAGNDDDIVSGGAGLDTINGGAGNDLIDGGQGNDNVRGGSGDDLLRGGPGDDFLDGEGNNDIALGGDGTDTVEGGSGRDVLIGGRGLDSITGESGDDILINGRTTHDDDNAALAAILASWNSADSYQARVATLRSTHLTSVTVIHDGAIDQLTGGTNFDWFWYNLGQDTTDIATNELTN